VKVKIIILILLGGVYLMISGEYETFLGLTTFKVPKTISVAELKDNIPLNRHLKIIGGKADFQSAVTAYEMLKGQKVKDSEVSFIPVLENSDYAYSSSIPTILVRIPEDTMIEIQKKQSFDDSSIEGVRMTHLDLDSKATEFLDQRYGKEAVDKMLILEYKKDSEGLFEGLGKVICGAALILTAVFAARPRQAAY
jgi:hypothetical protein